MKTTVTVEVPDGDTCDDIDNHCDFWYRDSDTKDCYCMLFGFKALNQRFRPNMLAGKDVLKCDQCKVQDWDAWGNEVEGIQLFSIRSDLNG